MGAGYIADVERLQTHPSVMRQAPAVNLSSSPLSSQHRTHAPSYHVVTPPPFLQLTTRTFFYGDKEVLVPIVDLANHDNACQHTHRLEPCDPDLGLKQRSESLLPPPVPPSFASGVVVPVEGATPDADVQSRGVSGVCLVWRAESPVAMGMEVCNNYGLLLQDNALLQYGYMQVCVGCGRVGGCLMCSQVCWCVDTESTWVHASSLALSC